MSEIDSFDIFLILLIIPVSLSAYELFEKGVDCLQSNCFGILESFLKPLCFIAFC